jgi:Fe2+ or Zn2+ uptake regulation protein
MSISSLKSEIYKKLETLDEQGLLEVNKMVTTYLKNSKNCEHWDELTVAQQQGILQAIESIKNRKGIKHKEVMEKYRQKYA